jgi:predicted 2-oxoglutarate/Fe(II)-dependent dioxygenase YbiX
VSAVRFPLRESPWLKGVRVPWVAVVDEALDAEFCARLIARIEACSPAVAPITTAAGAVLNERVRNNDRVMFDDAALAAELFERTRATLPETFDGGTLVGFNERFRGYRYREGQRFAPHFDGAYARPETPAGRECSEITVLFYLNDGFTGGETKILDYEVLFVPRTGAALLFQHAILHEGCPVASGVKYVLRTDVMYWFARR